MQESFMSQTQRTQNFVDSHVQGALVKRVLGHWLMFFGVLAIATIGLQSLMGNPAQPLGQRLQSQIGEFMFLAVIMLAILPVFVLDTIRFSNRFVGPISRLRKGLRALKEGNAEPLTFRGLDFWTGMATEFNQVADLVAQQQAEIEKLKTQLDQFRIEDRTLIDTNDTTTANQ